MQLLILGFSRFGNLSNLQNLKSIFCAEDASLMVKAFGWLDYFG
jgi:hypothetical protein